MLSNGDTHGRILVVDDERDVSLFLKTVLEEHGFQVITFNDPLLALTNFMVNYYDLILLDIKMPKMDGFELYQELQKIDGKVKICLMTAFEFYYDALREMFPDSYESICFIRKPISINDFLKKIDAEVTSNGKTAIK